MYYDQYKWENYVQAENVDFRNCVMYNCQSSSACYGGPGGGQINIVNNYYKAGPSNTNAKVVTKVTVGADGNSTPELLWGMTSRYFINGNYVTAAGDKAANYDWKGVEYDGSTALIDGERYSKDPNRMNGSSATYAEKDGVNYVKIKLEEPCPTGDVTTHTAEMAYDKVLLFGGANLHRDLVDLRYVGEVSTGTATYTGPVTGKPGQLDFINDPDGEQNETYPSFPDLTSESRGPGFDTDGDGMPDEWEGLNGLDPHDSSDANTYTIDTKGWYTNIEVYLNALVEDFMKEGNADAEQSVDEYYPKCENPTTGINAHRVSANILSTEYYNLEGQRLEAPQKGIMIRVEQLASGHRIATKIIK